MEFSDVADFEQIVGQGVKGNVDGKKVLAGNYKMMRENNIEVSEDEIFAAVRPNTKLIFGESLSNPSVKVLDFEKFANVARRAGIPFAVDNTFPTPYLCRPFDYGANIVIHSLSKYADGHACSLGGIVIDKGDFDYSASDKFPGLTTPDESYHGLVYTKTFGNLAS